MSNARIYRHTQTAMQAGRAGAEDWVLEWEPASRQVADPLMGWIGQGDTQAQVRLRFPSREAALAYAERHGLSAQVELPSIRRVRPKAYADNFRVSRSENWTH
jgi:hypothetical protein